MKEFEIAKIETAKKEIINTFIINRVSISRNGLLKCLADHGELYSKGLLSYKNKKLLDTAVIEIWNNEFKTDLKTTDIISNL